MSEIEETIPNSTAWPTETALAEHARQEYGLPAVTAIRPMPGGWAARSYRVDDSAGRAYVLKVYDRSPDARFWLAATMERLPVLHTLRRSGLYPWLPEPIRTPAGSYLVGFGEYDLLLNGYIEGEHPPADSAVWPEELVQQLAERIAALHSLDRHDLFERMPREEYRLVFRAPLLAALERLQAPEGALRPGVLALRDLLLPRAERLLSLLDRTEQLAKAAAARGPALVPCHADLHHQNLILTPEGNPYLLDWEGLRLAPPEQDLFFWADEPVGVALLTHYRIARPQAHLSAETFAYYYHYRNLEDLEAWASRILNLDRGLEVDRRDVEAIRQYCLHWWDDLDGEVQRIQVRLDDVARALGQDTPTGPPRAPGLSAPPAG